MSNITKNKKEDVNLIAHWWNRKKEVDNGVYPTMRITDSGKSCVSLGLEGLNPQDRGYHHLLQAKVFEIFGVTDIHLALESFLQCLNLFTLKERLMEKDSDQGQEKFECISKNILSLFQEIRPRDSIDLMLVTKLIILDHLSNKEFMKSVVTDHEESKGASLNRGIKLSRLFIEVKERFDKHRRPDQHIVVQHNHINNEGQAVIAPHVSVGDNKEISSKTS